MALSTVSRRVGKFFAFGNAQGNAGLADLCLGAHQALAHRSGRHQEGRCDAGRIEAENSLQHERSADARINGRVRAGEHQRQAAIGDFILCGGVGYGFNREVIFFGRSFVLVPARRVDQLAPRNRQQPAFRIVRAASPRPVFQCCGEGFRQGVLSRGHISGPCSEERHQLSVTVARHRFGLFLHQRATARIHDCLDHRAAATASRAVYCWLLGSMAQIARISTTPWPTPGHFPAHESAASRSGTSIR